MLKLIYKLFRRRFNELLVEDTFGSIPQDLSEPSLKFLSNGKETLEKFFLIQSYQIQKKMARDHKNYDVYVGMLLIIKSFLSYIKVTTPEYRKVQERDNSTLKEDLDKSSDFIAQGLMHLTKNN